MAKGDVTMTFDAKTDAFITAVRKAADELNKVQGAAKTTGEKVVGLADVFDEWGKKIDQRNIGQTIAEQLGLPLSPADALAKAFAFIGESFEEMQKKLERGAAGLRSMSDPLKDIAQISHSASEYQARIMKARELSSTYGMSQPESLKLISEAANMGMEKDVNLFARVKSIDDPIRVMKGVGKMVANFPGTSPRAMLNMMATAQEPSQLMLGDMADSASIGASAARELGMDPAEYLSMVAMMSNVKKTGETAGERSKTLSEFLGSNRFTKEELQGRGLEGAIDAFKAYKFVDKKGNPKSTSDVMRTNREAAEAFRDFNNMRPQIVDLAKKARVESFKTGEGDRFSEIEGMMLMPKLPNGEDNPAYLKRQFDIAQVGEENAIIGRYGARGIKQEIAAKHINTRGVLSGAGEIAQEIGNRVGGAFTKLGASEATAGDAAAAAGNAVVNPGTGPLGMGAWLIDLFSKSGGNAMVPNNIDAGNE